VTITHAIIDVALRPNSRRNHHIDRWIEMHLDTIGGTGPSGTERSPCPRVVAATKRIESVGRENCIGLFETDAAVGRPLVGNEHLSTTDASV
jgi:hypothetical protein